MFADPLSLTHSECQSALGHEKFQEAYRFIQRMQQSSSFTDDNESDMVILEGLTRILGADKVHYWKLIDRLLFMEANV